MKKITMLYLLLVSSFFSIANVSLPKIFGDNMVLQFNKPIPIWGWAEPNEKVTVQFNLQTKSVKADRNGKWMLRLNNESAGGPYQLIVIGKNNSITIEDVLVGQVWICSGQSNMEFQVQHVMNAKEEIAAANYGLIHQFMVPKDIATIPKDDFKGGQWTICSPETVADFTAVGYFFARELYNELKMPVGLINTSWGGTHSETWTSRKAFESSDEFKNMIAGMPNLNLDSLALVRKEALMKQMKELQGGLPSEAVAETWKDIIINDKKWPEMKLPGLWESAQLGQLDGVVWFRKTIVINNEDAGKSALLELSMIDDNDKTYVNGIEVGATNSWNTKRVYQIPSGMLKEGDNIIAIRVEDTGGGGGIYGEAADMKITIDNHEHSLAGNWYFKVSSLLSGNNSIGPNDYPTLLFNAMLNPIIPFAIEGVIWYQGESNAGRAYQYRKAFPLMITDWRQHWGQGDFPFYFVQLASFNAGNGNAKTGSAWAELREAQTMTLSLPNTGMAVTTDIGNATDIHPTNKQDVGKRLAAIALHQLYQIGSVFSGPLYQSMKVEGNKIIVNFTQTGSGLMAKDKYGYLKGFEIAGNDKQFHFAKALIEGDHVVVFADDVINPLAVRFGWMDDAGEDNFFNKDGFPASPFRTDNWKGVTEAEKFGFVK